MSNKKNLFQFFLWPTVIVALCYAFYASGIFSWFIGDNDRPRRVSVISKSSPTDYERLLEYSRSAKIETVYMRDSYTNICFALTWNGTYEYGGDEPAGVVKTWVPCTKKVKAAIASQNRFNPTKKLKNHTIVIPDNTVYDDLPAGLAPTTDTDLPYIPPSPDNVIDIEIPDLFTPPSANVEVNK